MEEETQKKWRAQWVGPNGMLMQHLFYSSIYRVVARTDFQLELMRMRLPVPNEFELEEVNAGPILVKLTGDRRQEKSIGGF